MTSKAPTGAFLNHLESINNISIQRFIDRKWCWVLLIVAVFFVIMWTMDLVLLFYLSSQMPSAHMSWFATSPHVSEIHGADGGFQVIMAC